MPRYEKTHSVRIEYCAPCNYLNIAVGLADEILAQWGPLLTVLELVPTAWGTFEVTVDGSLLYSKWALARHARKGEVSRLVAEVLGPPLEAYVDHGPESFDENGFPIHLPSRVCR